MGYWDVHELRCINGPDVANSVMCRIVNGGPCVEVPDSSFGRLCERRCAHTFFRLSAVTDASSQVGETRRASTLALARLLPHLSRHASQASVHLVATLHYRSPRCPRWHLHALGSVLHRSRTGWAWKGLGCWWMFCRVHA